MLDRFITALIYEITRNFKNLENAKIPTPIKDYIKKEGESFIEDIEQTIQYLKDPQRISIKENGFLNSVAEFLSNTFINDIYKLPILFYKEDRKTQNEAVSKIIKSDSLLANTLKEMITENSYQELLEGLTKFLQATKDAPYIVVQTPIELDAAKKIEIKDKLKEKYTTCSPIFQINKNLIGGLRIFIDGKVQDFSWLGRINYITSINI